MSIVYRRKSARKVPLSIFLALLFLLIFSKIFYKLGLNLWGYYKAKKELSLEKRKNEQLKKEAIKIKEDNFLEYSARTKLGLKKEEEIEYRFTPPVSEKK